MPFTKPDGQVPAGAAPGPRVHIVMEQWAVPDDGDRGITVEAVHLTPEGASGNLAPSGELRERFIVEVETQP